ncbi:MAG: ribosome recycling factor [Candidatus Carsonella ruddii]
MDFISFTNNIENIKKIVNNYFLLFEKFNIKNININTINNIRFFLNKENFLIKNICDIKIINEKKFCLIFKDAVVFKKIIKNNFFENYGFQVLKQKNYINLIIPKLSLEFRKKILLIIKNEFNNHKNMIETNRKKIILYIKKNNKSIDELNILEKKLNKEIKEIKLNLINIYKKFCFKIIND